MKLSDLQSAGVGICRGGDCEFSTLSTDTRTLQVNDLFVAISGEHFDAHDYAILAKEKGVCGLVVERALNVALPQLVVKDSIVALGEIAAIVRHEFTGQVLAITGSCGKTSVKAMLKNICDEAGTCIATQGNFNNHIGVPLTLLRLTQEADFAVIEAGTSGVGEISYLTRLIKPDVALVNNVMPAHVEGFGTVEAIAREKSAIYGTSQNLSIPVVNLDDAHLNILLGDLGARKVVGFTSRAELESLPINCEQVITLVRAAEVTADALGRCEFLLVVGEASCRIQLGVLGRHSLNNALAAATCAYVMGVGFCEIKRGLESFTGENGRMQVLCGINGATIIDDSYNANPGSMKAAIDVLAGNPNSILVSGDMAELGGHSAAFHKELGVYAKTKGIGRVYTVGKDSRGISSGFGSEDNHCENKDDLIKRLISTINEISCVLVKGSRSAKMETVVKALTSNEVMH
ncbi:MAG: UDP-N-acetylmuramoyl-tripeptide--D-alanyl-D-alanine ligase [Lentisphaeria bacterium]|jgi:UDP-N-acetylmuramoyl-tripeptide--D-alanyl-D-alanine ligase